MRRYKGEQVYFTIDISVGPVAEPAGQRLQDSQQKQHHYYKPETRMQLKYEIIHGYEFEILFEYTIDSGK